MFNAFNQDTICITHGIQTINSGNPPGGLYTGDGVFGNTFDPNMAGIGMQYIIYEYTDSLGCSNSSTDSVLVDYCLVIPVNTGISGNAVLVYPNPASDVINIVWFAGTRTMDKMEIEICDIVGRKIKSITCTDYSKQGQYPSVLVDITDLTAGNYLIKLRAGLNCFSCNRFSVIK